MYGHMRGIRRAATGALADPSLFGDGSAAAPSISFAADTDLGIYRVSANVLGIGGAAAERYLHLDGAATPAGPRAYINDAALTKAAFMAVRGTGTSDGNVPDATYTGALMVNSFHAGNSTDYTAEAIKGAVYASEGAGGLHLGVSGVAETPSAGSWTASGTHGIIGVFGQATGYKASTRTWGGNLIANQFSGTGGTLTGLEVGVEAQVACDNRYGIQIVTLSGGTNSGGTEDIAIKLADKNDPLDEGNLWAVGLGFGSPGVTGSVGMPIKATGTLIKSYGTKTIANGIDFSSHAFSGFAFKTDTFQVSSVGRLSVRTNAAASGTPLRMDANGDTYNFEIENAVIAVSAGAATGTFMTIRLSGTTYKLELFAAA